MLEHPRTLEWRPASFVRLQIVRPKFAKQGEPGAGVVIAEVADSPVPRSLAGPGLLAHVLVSKYGDHLPLHRQEKIFERQGVHLARSTLCGWVSSCAEVLGHLVGAMAKDALSAHCIAIDATGVLPQQRPARTRCLPRMARPRGTARAAQEPHRRSHRVCAQPVDCAHPLPRGRAASPG
ncbi:transposase [Sorangium sp. So ce296]